MQRPRTPSKLSSSVHHQLNSYALAASAAGVSLLALAQPAEFMLPAGAALASLLAFSEPAEARIVYTTQNITIGPTRGHYNLDLNHDGVRDFTIREYTTNSTSLWTKLFVAPAGVNAADIVADKRSSYFHLAVALNRGSRIGPSKFRYGGDGTMVFNLWMNGSYDDRGYWFNVTDRYLGLQFQIKGKTHYGWARLSVSVGTYLQVNATLTGYAYETIPGKPIIAGKTHGKDVITVEPASLGHLARGASAIPTWRKKEPAAATH